MKLVSPASILSIAALGLGQEHNVTEFTGNEIPKVDPAIYGSQTCYFGAESFIQDDIAYTCEEFLLTNGDNMNRMAFQSAFQTPVITPLGTYDNRWTTLRITDKWIIPYKYDVDYNVAGMDAFIKTQDQHLKERTCIRLIEMDNEWYSSAHHATDAPHGIGYINIENNGGCNSFVGKRTDINVNVINMQNGCQESWVHEVGHALGYKHEHTRPDKGHYLRHSWQWFDDAYWITQHHTLPGNNDGENFYFWENFGWPHDVQSVMHYGGKGLGNNKIGDRWGGDITAVYSNKLKYELTPADADNINKAYQCMEIEFPRNKELNFFNPDQFRNFIATLDDNDELSGPSLNMPGVKFGLIYLQDTHKREGSELFAIMRLSDRMCLDGDFTIENGAFTEASYISCSDAIVFLQFSDARYHWTYQNWFTGDNVSLVKKADDGDWLCYDIDLHSGVSCNIEDMTLATGIKSYTDYQSAVTVKNGVYYTFITPEYIHGKWMINVNSGSGNPEDYWHIRVHGDLCDGLTNGYCEFGFCQQDTPTTTSCQCLPGWQPNQNTPWVCEEMNECELFNPCGYPETGGGQCLNAPGRDEEPMGYRCRCEPGEEFDYQIGTCIQRNFGTSIYRIMM